MSNVTRIEKGHVESIPMLFNVLMSARDFTLQRDPPAIAIAVAGYKAKDLAGLRQFGSVRELKLSKSTELSVPIGRPDLGAAEFKRLKSLAQGLRDERDAAARAQAAEQKAKLQAALEQEKDTGIPMPVSIEDRNLQYGERLHAEAVEGELRLLCSMIEWRDLQYPTAVFSLGGEQPLNEVHPDNLHRVAHLKVGDRTLTPYVDDSWTILTQVQKNEPPAEVVQTEEAPAAEPEPAKPVYDGDVLEVRVHHSRVPGPGARVVYSGAPEGFEQKFITGHNVPHVSFTMKGVLLPDETMPVLFDVFQLWNQPHVQRFRMDYAGPRSQFDAVKKQRKVWADEARRKEAMARTPVQPQQPDPAPKPKPRREDRRSNRQYGRRYEYDISGRSFLF